MRYFLELAYKGTKYCGWQRQPGDPSVQQEIEEGLSKLLKTEIVIVGCGRTDTGVHAAIYTAHFETEREDADSADFLYHLNCVLPRDIAIHKIYKTDLHARFDAVYREYKYYITRRKDPFATESSWLITVELDVEKMRRASEILMNYEDFGSMCKVGSDNKTTLCKIYKMDWEEKGNMLIFTVGANRFLRGMVRAVVGTLVDVGRGKITTEDIHSIMRASNRSAASAAAPPQGLFLTDIKYEK